MKHCIPILLSLCLLSGCGEAAISAELAPKRAVYAGVTSSSQTQETDISDSTASLELEPKEQSAAPDADAEKDAITEQDSKPEAAYDGQESASKIARRLRGDYPAEQDGLQKQDGDDQKQPDSIQDEIDTAQEQDIAVNDDYTQEQTAAGLALDDRRIISVAAPTDQEADDGVEKAPQPTATPADVRRAKQLEAAAQVDNEDFLANVEMKVLELQNEERVKKGLPELQYDKNLSTSARIRSRELCATQTFAHTRPDGRDWETVLYEDVPVIFAKAGENLAMSQYTVKPGHDKGKDASFWVGKWKDSPTHYENMIRPQFTHAGVGIYYVKDGGVTYAYATTHYATYS